eukprot:6487044-Amphidinium_carterae.1
MAPATRLCLPAMFVPSHCKTSGSLGTVFKGLDQQSGKLLAVKELCQSASRTGTKLAKFATPCCSGREVLLDCPQSVLNLVHSSVYYAEYWTPFARSETESTGSPPCGVQEVRLDHKLDADLKLKASLENEIRIYKDLHHPKIVSYLGHDYIDRSMRQASDSCTCTTRKTLRGRK